MALSLKISIRLILSKLCLSAILTIPLLMQGQTKTTTFKPFKFDLQESFLPANEVILHDEILKVLAAQQEIGEDNPWPLRYWNGAYPSYRWNQLLIEVGENHKGHKNGGRMAIMHLAIYDAMVEVWEHKKAHFREAAYKYDPRIKRRVIGPEYSSFLCEWSAAAGAAHRVIGYYFPEQKELLDSQLMTFKSARLATGLQFPSDIEKGLEIGQKIADQYIEYAKSDHTDLRWQGSVPKTDSLWTGDPGPWDPMKRQWRPLTLVSGDQYRPGPPPTDWSVDMEELKRFNSQHRTSEIAWKWKSEPIWDRLIERKILEYNLTFLEAAFANAVFHTARFDGIIAAWDGKYHYWGIRPFQYDPSFQPILVDTPNFPGYPAGHTTVAGSIATVLSFLFPEDEALFHELAKECSESRFEGGVHFRTDNEVGLEVGYRVGQQVINTFK